MDCVCAHGADVGVARKSVPGDEEIGDGCACCEDMVGPDPSGFVCVGYCSHGVDDVGDRVCDGSGQVFGWYYLGRTLVHFGYYLGKTDKCVGYCLLSCEFAIQCGNNGYFIDRKRIICNGLVEGLCDGVTSWY